jgi:hypothetical protein
MMEHHGPDEHSPIEHAFDPAAWSASRLTASDRRAIAQARELNAGLGNAEAVQKRTGETDPVMAYATIYGEARWVIGDLLAIIERLDSVTPAQMRAEEDDEYLPSDLGTNVDDPETAWTRVYRRRQADR